MSRQQQITALRYDGMSYNEIARALQISKSAISYWLKGISLPPEAQEKLRTNLERAKRLGLLDANKKRAEKVQAENKEIRLKAASEISAFSQKHLFLIGVALYWGEGGQSEHNANSLGLRFTNSNPAMIALFLRFLREILQIEDSRIKAHIHAHQNVNRNEAVKFWAGATRLPTERFCWINQVSRASKNVRPIHSLPHGTLDIRVNNRALFMRMKGWVDGFAKQGSLKS